MHKGDSQTSRVCSGTGGSLGQLESRKHWGDLRETRLETFLSGTPYSPPPQFPYQPFFFLLINLFLAHCAWAFSSCGKRGLLFAVRRLLIVVASLVVEHGL